MGQYKVIGKKAAPMLMDGHLEFMKQYMASQKLPCQTSSCAGCHQSTSPLLLVAEAHSKISIYLPQTAEC